MGNPEERFWPHMTPRDEYYRMDPEMVAIGMSAGRLGLGMPLRELDEEQLTHLMEGLYCLRGNRTEDPCPNEGADLDQECGCGAAAAAEYNRRKEGI